MSLHSNGLSSDHCSEFTLKYKATYALARAMLLARNFRHLEGGLLPNKPTCGECVRWAS